MLTYFRFLAPWLLALTLPLCAERVDPKARTFEERPERKHRVDVYDFSGEFDQLEKISINARRKKCVELDLSGSYPVLETIRYEGSFGELNAKLTGDFPKTERVDILCGHCALLVDLSGTWHQSCNVALRGGDENITIVLPKDVGVVVHTHTGLKGKVEKSPLLKKIKFFGVFSKTFANVLAPSAPIVLHLDVEINDGRVIFLEEAL